MGMSVNPDKTKFMLIHSNKVTYNIFLYDNNNLEEVTSYKYLRIDSITSLTRTITSRKGSMEGGKLILVLKTIISKQTL